MKRAGFTLVELLVVLVLVLCCSSANAQSYGPNNWTPPTDLQPWASTWMHADGSITLRVTMGVPYSYLFDQYACQRQLRDIFENSSDPASSRQAKILLDYFGIMPKRGILVP